MRRAKRALEALDADAMVELYAIDAFFSDASSGQVCRGTEEIGSMLRELFAAPGAAFSDVVIREGEGWGAIEWVWQGTAKAKGERSSIRGASVLELQGGKIVRETIYYNPRATGP